MGIAGDLVHPGGVAVLLIVSMAVAQNPKEYFLHQVLACLAFGRQSQEEMKQGAMMLFKQQREFAQVSTAHLFHDYLIAKVGQLANSTSAIGYRMGGKWLPLQPMPLYLASPNVTFDSAPKRW